MEIKSPVVNKVLRFRIFTELIFLLKEIGIPGVPVINLRCVTNPVHSKRCIFKFFVILLASMRLRTCLKLSTRFCALLDLISGFSKTLKTDNNNNNKTAIIKTVTLRWLPLWLH